MKYIIILLVALTVVSCDKNSPMYYYKSATIYELHKATFTAEKDGNVIWKFEGFGRITLDYDNINGNTVRVNYYVDGALYTKIFDDATVTEVKTPSSEEITVNI